MVPLLLMIWFVFWRVVSVGGGGVLVVVDVVVGGGNCCFVSVRVLLSVAFSAFCFFLVVASFYVGVVGVDAVHHVFSWYCIFYLLLLW